MFKKAKGVIDGYTIVKTLGEGGNAVVKEVVKDKIHYAMKVFQIHPEDQEFQFKKIQQELDVVEGLDIDDIPRQYGLV